MSAANRIIRDRCGSYLTTSYELITLSLKGEGASERDGVMAWIFAKQIAQAILSGFERHFSLFQAITADARQRFEAADWKAVQDA